jgi:osmoprotectant transport system ATP-binding protein
MIEFEHVVKVFPGGLRAVDDLSLTVEPGEIGVLIGPSGCGKTTSMRMVNRLIPITSGRIVVDGRDNREIPGEELRRKIGYAIQQIGLFPHMTVRQNVSVVPRLLGWDEERVRRRVDALLELVGLDPDVHRDKYPRQLSGGQQQRVGVARALGADPPIMLMDEPFGAVDPITRLVLQDEFLQIQRAIGKTVLFVTHDIDEAIKMGDRIAILRDGKLVQHGTPDDLLAHPADEFVREFVGADRELKRLGLIRVRDVMGPPPSVPIDTGMAEARETLKRHDWPGAFVVDERGRLRGWLPRDATGARATIESRLRRLGASDDAVPERASVRDALSKMVAHGFEATPVVDAEGRLTGVITPEALRAALTSDEEGGEA